MSGIVLELQQEALSKKADVESLLRKAYVIAKKLKLKDFEEWIKLEQNGYSEKNNVPDYRYVRGTFRAYNPALGQWIPMGLSGGGANKFSKLPIIEAVSSLETLYVKKGDNISFSISSQMTEMFNKTTPFETIYAFDVSKSQIYKILSTVQDKILDWALLLEESGIIGEGLSFTEMEIKKAEQSSIINQYVNNFYANVEEIDLQQGNSDSI